MSQDMPRDPDPASGSLGIRPRPRPRIAGQGGNRKRRAYPRARHERPTPTYAVSEVFICAESGCPARALAPFDQRNRTACPDKDPELFPVAPTSLPSSKSKERIALATCHVPRTTCSGRRGLETRASTSVFLCFVRYPPIHSSSHFNYLVPSGGTQEQVFLLRVPIAPLPVF
jgi:hypothetical protein